MKIQINAELTGNEISEIFIANLKASNITAEPSEIKVQVQDKQGKFVDFDPAKIKFSYSK